MSDESILMDLLRSDPGVTSVVPSRSFFASTLPAGATVPAITVTFRGGPGRSMTLDGATGHDRRRAEISCWASTPTEARRAARAVRAILDGYVGPVAGPSSCIHLARCEAPFDIPEPEPGLHRCAVIVDIWFS